MNFAIKRYTVGKTVKKKVTAETDNEGLAHWAEHAEKGATLKIKSDALDYETLRELKGYIRIDQKWKAFVIHHPNHIEILHCGPTPSFS